MSGRAFFKGFTAKLQNNKIEAEWQLVWFSLAWP